MIECGKVRVMLETKDLRKVFLDGNHVNPVLRNINLELHPGEVTLLSGPSGSGKTTLLMILALIDTQISGDIIFKDKIINRLSETDKQKIRGRNISIIFQDLHLIPYINVQDNIRLPIELLKLDFSHMEYSNELMDTLGISHLTDKHVDEISTGERQRACIARSLAIKPDIILADEPTSNLDRKNAKNVIELLNRHAGESQSSVLVASHDKMLSKYVDNVLHLQDGVLITTK